MTVVVRTARWAALVSVLGAVTARYALDSAVGRVSLSTFGDFALLMTLAALLAPVAALGLSEVGARYVAEFARGGQVAKLRWFLTLSSVSALTFGVALGVVAALVLMLVRGLQFELAVALCLVVPSLAWLNTRRAQALQLGGGNAVLLASALSTGISVVLVVVGHQIDVPSTLMWFGGCVAVGNVAIAYLLCRPHIPQVADAGPSPTRGEAFAWVRAGSHAVSNAVASVVLTQGDIIIIGLILGGADAGSYAAASRLALVVTLALGGLIPREAPILGQLVASGDRAGAWRHYRQACVMSGACGAVICVVLWAAGTPILDAFVPGSASAVGWLSVLAAGRLIAAMVGPAAELMIALGAQALAAGCSWAGAVVGVTLMVALGASFGPMGVAVGASIGMAARSTLHFLLARHRCLGSRIEGV